MVKCMSQLFMHMCTMCSALSFRPSTPLGALVACPTAPKMTKAAAFTAVEPKPTELTVFGQLQGATGLAASSAHCMWRISHGKTWTLERGEGSGSSQTATTNENGAIVWSQPVDAVLIGSAWRPGSQPADRQLQPPRALCVHGAGNA